MRGTRYFYSCACVCATVVDKIVNVYSHLRKKTLTEV